MNTTRMQMRIIAMRYEAENTLSLELSAPGYTPLPSVEPGAHIDLYLPDDIVRSYSLITPRCTPSSYVVAILLDKNSRGGSRFIHQQLRTGNMLEISSPRNHFRLEETAGNTVLIAGGIGITPIFSMYARLLELGRPVSLLYCVRSRQQAALVQDITRLQSPIEWHIDEEAGAPPDLHAYLARFEPTTHFYCCGPSPMLDRFEAVCETLGYPHIHIERFTPSLPIQSSEIPENGYLLELARSQQTIRVEAGQSLADALQTHGIKVDFSCREGICGACETRVLEGTVIHRDSVLSKTERAANKTMMVCVSRCAGDKLVLDL